MRRSKNVSIATEPAGADVFLFRFEEGREGRLRPLPYQAAGRTSRPVPGRESGESDGPLECLDENRVGSSPLAGLPLPSGSYLFLLRAAGCRDTRLPVFVSRESKTEASVRLPRPVPTPQDPGTLWYKACYFAMDRAASPTRQSSACSAREVLR